MALSKLEAVIKIAGSSVPRAALRIQISVPMPNRETRFDRRRSFVVQPAARAPSPHPLPLPTRELGDG